MRISILCFAVSATAFTTRLGPSIHRRSHVTTTSSTLFATIAPELPQFDDQTDDSDSSDAAHLNLLGPSIAYEKLTIGVLKEDFPGETRVSQSPNSVKTLVNAGFSVVVEEGGRYTDETHLNDEL